MRELLKSQLRSICFGLVAGLANGCGVDHSSQRKSGEMSGDGGAMAIEPSPYLKDAAAEYARILPFLRIDYSRLSQVEAFPEQAGLSKNSINPVSPDPVLKRAEELNLYFSVVRSLSESLVSGDASIFRSAHPDAIDESTGAWTASLKAIALRESLELPEPALLAGLDLGMPGLTVAEIEARERIARGLIGDDSGAFMIRLADRANSESKKLARSMRRAKLLLRLSLASHHQSLPYFFKGTYSSRGPATPDFAASGLDTRIDGLGWDYVLAADPVTGRPSCNLLPLDETIKKVKADYNPAFIYYVDDYHNLCPALGDASLAARILSAIHEAVPGMVVGFYAFAPEVAHWEFINDSPEWRAKYEYMKQMNELRIAAMGDDVDMIMPSAYVLYKASLTTNSSVVEAHKPPVSSSSKMLDPGLSVYKAARSGLMAEAKRLAAMSHKQPVLAFMWPQYHPNAGYDANERIYVSGALYAMAIAQLKADRIDGIIHWDAVSGSTPWDPTFDNPFDGITSWFEVIASPNRALSAP